MDIHGRNIGFLRTVLATCEIADLSPDGDVNRFDSLLQSPKYAVTQRAAAGFIAALSKGYEMAKAFDDPKYSPKPLSVNEALNLDENTFNELFMEALTAWTGEKPTVEAEEVKGKGKNGDGDGESN